MRDAASLRPQAPPRLNDALVVRLGPDRGRPTMLCLPHAGAGVGAFHWLLPRDLGVDLLAVQLPGRERRLHESPFHRAPQAVERIAEALARGSWPAPEIYYGHSMGALLALALARDRAPSGPRVLVLGGAAPPHLPRLTGPKHRLDDHALLAELRRMGGVPTPVLESPALLSLLLPTLRADLELCETGDFRAGKEVDCELHVLLGRDDPMAPASTGHGWRRYTRGRLVLHAFAGGHFFHHEDPATVTKTLLRAVQASKRG